MKNEAAEKFNSAYFYSVVLLTLVLPGVSVLINFSIDRQANLLELTGKWFVFLAIGVRLFTAGLRQIFNPAFTAKEIFHLKDRESFTVVKELGFANVCLGMIAFVSLFVAEWRAAAACAGALFFGLASAVHLTKKPDSLNEKIATASDVFIFLVTLVYLLARLFEK